MQKDIPKTCYIYAHRGANKEAAENTHAAFSQALSYPIDGIETDVQLTLDEISVLWHDPFLDKLGYPEQHIDDFTFAELKQLNFALHFKNAAQESVLSLKEFVKQYRNRCRLQIEIKNYAWEAPHRHQIKIRQCLEILKSSQNLDVFISSFNLDCLQYAAQLNTEIPLVYAFEDSSTVSQVKKICHHQPFLSGYCLPINLLNPALVDFLRARHQLIVTYTCNTQQAIQKALTLKVDILITDDPKKALQMRG